MLKKVACLRLHVCMVISVPVIMLKVFEFNLAVETVSAMHRYVETDASKTEICAFCCWLVGLIVSLSCFP